MIQLHNILFFLFIYCFLYFEFLTANELKLEENKNFQNNKKTWITLDPFDNIELHKNNDTNKNEEFFNLQDGGKCEENLMKVILLLLYFLKIEF